MKARSVLGRTIVGVIQSPPPSTDEVVEIVRWAPLSRFPGSPWGSRLVRRINRTEVSS